MPFKKEFERDLVRVNIRRKDRDGILSIKRDPAEPMYSLVQRIWFTYNSKDGVLEYENEILKQSVQTLMKLALDAEIKLPIQETLG